MGRRLEDLSSILCAGFEQARVETIARNVVRVPGRATANLVEIDPAICAFDFETPDPFEYEAVEA